MKNVYNITYNNLNVWRDNDFENKIKSIQKELEEAGINQLVEEVKRQTEEWKTRQLNDII